MNGLNPSMSPRPALVRRASVYVLILAASLLVSVIGVSALLAARVQHRTASSADDIVKARLNAQSALNLALLAIDQDPNWRQTYTHDTWEPVVSVGDGTCKWKLVDDKDADLKDDPFDSVSIVAWGMAGVATQKLSVRLETEPEFTIQTSVQSTNDDAEQRFSDGYMHRTSDDLELAEHPGGNSDIVGMRFRNLTIPQGAMINRAHIQFQVEEPSSGVADLTIHGQAADNAPSFSDIAYDMTSRTTTAASVGWSVPQWATVGEAGSDQRTPDLAPVIREIVNRPGWAGGNAMVVIVSGSGTRTRPSRWPRTCF